MSLNIVKGLQKYYSNVPPAITDFDPTKKSKIIKYICKKHNIKKQIFKRKQICSQISKAYLTHKNLFDSILNCEKKIYIPKKKDELNVSDKPIIATIKNVKSVNIKESNVNESPKDYKPNPMELRSRKSKPQI